MALKKKETTAQSPETADHSAGALKRKARIFSTEAAAISIGIHLLLVLLAGSWVAVRYVQKQKAEITVYNEPVRKTERRQMLPLPEQKLQRVRDTSQRPKIVSTRAAVSSSEFSLPAVTGSGTGTGSTQTYRTPFTGSNRDFSMLTKGITFRIPNFRFLGVRAQGEKLIFIIEASPEMLKDETGGEEACAYIKQELSDLLDEMSASVIFNVIFFNGKTVATFQPKMVPATDENLLELDEWLAPALSSLSPQGLTPEQNTYEPLEVYDSAVGEDASGWALAMQSALEQRPDAVFVVGSDWGRHALGARKGRILMDFSLWEILSGSIERADALLADREMRDDYIVQAVEAVEEEEKELRRDDPVPFLRSLLDYMQYSGDQIIEHVRMVCSANYEPVEQPPPQIHFIRLAARSDVGVADESVRNMRELTRKFEGRYKDFNGMSVLDSQPRRQDAEETVEEVEEVLPESSLSFFGTHVGSSRIAFVLDVSDAMFEERTGGEASFAQLKDEIARTVRTLTPGTRANLIACRGKRVVAFAPELTDAINVDELDAWLAAVQQGLEMPGLASNKVVELPVTLYKTAVGRDIQGVPLGIQAAMEQRADAILVAGGGVARLPVSHEKAQRVFDFSILHNLGDIGEDNEEPPELLETDNRGMLAALEEDQERWRALMLQAIDLMEKDNEAREDADLPLRFVRDPYAFIQYTSQNILDHLQTVARSVYPAGSFDKVELPDIHFAKLLDFEANTEREQLQEFRGFEDTFGSKAELVEGVDPDLGERPRLDLSVLPRRRTTGIPKFKAFDLRAKGERVVFIVDASPEMLSESTGGEMTCTHIKQEVLNALLSMPTSAVFNVILHDGETVMEFDPAMAPVTKEKLLELKEWLTPVLSEDVLGLMADQNTYVPETVYETALDSGAHGWVRAMQSALERHPDSILVVGRGWGRHDISPEKGQGLMDFSLWQVLGGEENVSISMNEVFTEDRSVRDNSVVAAVTVIVEEVEESADAGDDEGGVASMFGGEPFVHKLPDYMQYSGNQILEHLNVVCLQNYLPADQGPPIVNWVRLAAENEMGVSDISTRKIRRMLREYDGEFALLDGETVRQKLEKERRKRAAKEGGADDEALEDDEEWDDAASDSDEEAVELVESEFNFFGRQINTESVAFVLDLSEEMFDENTGGDVPFTFIKGQLTHMVEDLTPGTEFMILAADDDRTVAFWPDAGGVYDPDELTAWLDAVQFGLEMPGLSDEQAGDVRVLRYDTAIGDDVKGLTLAIQVAMEHCADTILLMEANMGHLPVSREKSRRLLDLAILTALGPPGGTATDSTGDERDRDGTEVELLNEYTEDLGNTVGDAMVAPLQSDNSQLGSLMGQALDLMEEENERREKEELEPGFIRDIYDYIEYTPMQILAHLTAVAMDAYEDTDIQQPRIHFVKLADPEEPPDRDDLRFYEPFETDYFSEVIVLLGSPTEEEIRKANRSINLYEDDDSVVPATDEPGTAETPVPARPPKKKVREEW